MGLVCCKVDHALFYSWFTSSPHPLIPITLNSDDLVIFMPIHIDDGLVVTNSLPLYQWVLAEMNKQIKVNDLGTASLYLGIRIDHDCPSRHLWLSQKYVITVKTH